MTAICFIGDSHTAAMRMGWNIVQPDLPDTEITFFSAHRMRFADLAVEGDRLVPQTEELARLMKRSGKTEPVITGDYDGYILCGMDYSLLYAMNQLRSFKSEDQSSDYRAPLSSECYLRAMTGCLRDTVSMQVARKVRAITDRPMTIVPGPRISDANEAKMYPLLCQSGDAEKIVGYYARASKTLCEEVDASLREQPSQTLSNPLQTLAEYAKDPPREFNITPQPEGWKDYQHMNADYGALMLRALFAPPAT